MNKMYIVHLVSEDLVSNIIRLGNLLNHKTKVGTTHTALVYENNDGKKFIVEANPSVNVHYMEFDKYFKEQYIDKKLNYLVNYTPIEGLLPNKNSFEEFQDFLDTRYIGAKYSIKKALNSFALDYIDPKVAIDAIAEEKAKQELSVKGIAKNFFKKIFLNTKTMLYTMVRNKTRKLINQIKDSKLDYFVNLGAKMTKTDIEIMYELEDEESDNVFGTKFFYCTELVLRILREWCKEKNLELPKILQYPKLAVQKPENVYPEELKSLIEEQGKNNIIKTID